MIGSRSRNRARGGGATLTPAQAAAAVFAKYPGNAHVYLPANAFQDAAGTVPANSNGNLIALIKDLQGGVNAAQSTTAQQPAIGTVAGKQCMVFNFANSDSEVTTPLWGAGDDSFCCVGISNATATQANGAFFVSLAVNDAGFATYGGAAFNSSGWQGTWSNVSGLQVIQADLTVPAVDTIIRRGTTGIVRMNGVQQNTASLTGIGTSVPNDGRIGRLTSGDGNGFTGNIFAIAAIKGTVTDADALIVEQYINTLTPTGVSF